MTTVGNLLGLGGAAAAVATGDWRFYGIALVGIPIALWFGHRADSPRRNRLSAWVMTAAVAAAALWTTFGPRS